MNDLLSVVVNGYDGYSDAWSPFYQLFTKYWENCPYPKYFISGDNVFPFLSFKSITTSKEFNACTRLKTALNRIKSKYILLFQEDYFLVKNVNNENIEIILDYMEKNKIDCMRLHPSPKPKGKEEIISQGLKCVKITNGTEYCINLQLSIWRKDYFLELIKPLSTVWDIEYLGSKNCHKDSRLFSLSMDTWSSVIVDISTEGAIQGGYWTRLAYAYMKKNNIVFSENKIKQEKLIVYFRKWVKRKILWAPIKLLKHTFVYAIYRKKRYNKVIKKTKKYE